MANTTVTGPQVRASGRYIRIAPNKARQVIQHIRGLPVAEARNVLIMSPKEIARQLVKILDSAVANAEHNDGLDTDELVVVRATVDEGPTLRRFQARAMGRAYRIRKRTSHITIVVSERARPTRAAPATPAPAPTSEAEPETKGEPEADADSAAPEAGTDTEDKE